MFAANLGLNTYAAKIDEQAPSVRRIEDQHSLINKLEQISQRATTHCPTRKGKRHTHTN